MRKNKQKYPKLKTDWLSLVKGSFIAYREAFKYAIKREPIPEVMYLGDK